MWKISKSFDFCYGHRVWNQKLNKEFSLDSCLACRHLHGHQGKVIVRLTADKLESGMVTDFKHLNWFKKWLDDVLDHKFIMDINDPAREKLFPLTKCDIDSGEEFDKIFEIHNEGYYRLWPNVYENMSKPEIEIYEGLIFVNFVPTSENLSAWLFDIVRKRMFRIGVTTREVEFQETPKSVSVYMESDPTTGFTGPPGSGY